MTRLLFTLLVTVTGAPPAPAPPRPPMAGRDLLRAMHDRYAGRWYHTLTFTQRNTATRPDGTTELSTWLEFAALPGRLRIEILPADSGQGLLFSYDSQYVFRGDSLVSATAFIHPLMVLGFDVYLDPVVKTVARLEQLKFDLAAPVREDTWEGRPVYVVGAKAGDLRARQFWVDKERLVFVRMLEPGRRDTARTSDIRFNKYEPAGAAWVSAEVAFLVDGRQVWLEEYSEIKTDAPLAPALFDARDWKRARAH
jgi:hypothetical protein